VLKHAIAALAFSVISAQPLLSAERPPQAAPAPAPPPQPDVKPYDPQLLRLAEILGALTYLRGVCGATDADAWHKRMQTLLAAEGTTAIRKDRLAGAFNRGVEGYALSYRTCTANAHMIIERFLAEGSQIARDVENRFGAT
jgi:uncharacterized protein (TIGR02301 family)